MLEKIVQKNKYLFADEEIEVGKPKKKCKFVWKCALENVRVRTAFYERREFLHTIPSAYLLLLYDLISKHVVVFFTSSLKLAFGWV